MIRSRFFLAPLAGYTSLAFRLAVRGCGGLGPGDDRPGQRPVAASSSGAGRSSWPRPATRTGRWRSSSTATSSPRWKQAARWVEGHGATVVDINMGCPVRKVVRSGGGSALMCQVDRAVELVGAVVRAVSIPVTVKMRLGWDDESLTAPALAREFEQVGAAAVIVHGQNAAAGVLGHGQPPGHPRRGRGRRHDPGRGQRRRPDDRRRGDACSRTPAARRSRSAAARWPIPFFFRQLDHWAAPASPAPTRPSTSGST